MFSIFLLTCETTGMTGWDGESLNISRMYRSFFLPFSFSFFFNSFCFWSGLLLDWDFLRCEVWVGFGFGFRLSDSG